jgi:hypothetical protein
MITMATKQILFGALIFIVSLFGFLIVLSITEKRGVTHGLGYLVGLAPIFWTAGVLYFALGCALHFGLRSVLDKFVIRG